MRQVPSCSNDGLQIMLVRLRRIRWTVAALILSLFSSSTLSAQGLLLQSSDDEKPKKALSLPNIPAPTLGGKQFWTDHAWRRGWKIQQNVVTSHWRLIDDRRVRQAWGSLEACEQALAKKVPDPNLRSKQVVILLHGLMRSSDSLAALGNLLVDQLRCEVVPFEYASTRGSISDHATALRDVVASLPQNSEFSFVGHSLGNIIVRHAIGDWQRAGDEATLQRVKQVVMLGPPNQGASIARQLSKVGLFKWVTGKSGMELGPEWAEFEAKLAVPHCAFGIVAGRLPDQVVDNPLVDGKGDFVVSVEETKLPGAKDFLEVPRIHSFLMDDPIVQQAVVQFIHHQRF